MPRNFQISFKIQWILKNCQIFAICKKCENHCPCHWLRPSLVNTAFRDSGQPGSASVPRVPLTRGTVEGGGGWRSDQLLPFRQRLTRVIRVIRWKIREMSKVNTVNTLLVNTVNTLFGQRLTRYKYLWLTRLIRVIRVIH